MIDPPREEIELAVDRCRQAGIRPVMITGDHPSTARAIAREIHIAADDDRMVTGQELDGMTNDDLARQVEEIAVYARTSAEHKQRIVEAWRKRGAVVAMTGDGVNDAPAVKVADIGIAMGLTGTDVTKEASDMVLTDDNFASIVNAVEEGRGIFDNIQKVVHYLLACNAGEMGFMFLSALAGWPVPLLPIQLLWINLITDGFPALALAVEPPEPDIMQRPPWPPREPVITRRGGLLITVYGSLIAATMAAGFWLTYDAPHANLAQARTAVFCVACYTQLFFAFAARSQRYTLPQLGLFSNPRILGAIALSGMLQAAIVMFPPTQRWFDVIGLAPRQWVTVLLISLVPVTIVEVAKLVRVRPTTKSCAGACARLNRVQQTKNMSL
jgi:Ca2+-transporting ATPase